MLYHYPNEIRDPIHVLIRFDASERKVVDWRLFQRLRHIHQLGPTYLVYPGATHRRFEHSLGVMELATRIFDVVTNPLNRHVDQNILPELHQDYDFPSWRRALRVAALCHDLGHGPFSHAGESGALPEGWRHEMVTARLLQEPEFKELLEELPDRPLVQRVIKLAVGPRYLPEEKFTNWEAILSEIITSDTFGADRMDYLLRDSYHAGVPYGRFDHHWLIDSLRILQLGREAGSDASTDPTLGIERNALRCAESLLTARYFMFCQVYQHHVRRAYDCHLVSFLKHWLRNCPPRIDGDTFVDFTDTEVMAAMVDAVRDGSRPGHDHARRIIDREHFKIAYELEPGDFQYTFNPGEAIAEALTEKFGPENVMHDEGGGAGAVDEFPVLTRDRRVLSSHALSEILPKMPATAYDYVFVRPDLRDDARRWLRDERLKVLESVMEDKNE